MKLPKQLENALARQWSIMPLRADKTPYLAKWKWLQETRPTREQVEEWQREFNPPAWALITGAISGVFVTDHDDYAPGAITLESLGLQGKENVQTVNNGKHVYWKHPGYKVPTLNSKSAQVIAKAGFPGFDIRGEGGYVVFCGRCTKKNANPEAPPETGAYKWLRPIDETLTPDLLPEALRDALKFWPPDVLAERFKAKTPAPAPRAATPPAAGNGKRKKPLPQWALEEALKRQDSGRNAAGFWLAQQLRDDGMSEGEAVSFLSSQFVPQVKTTNTKGQHEPYTAEEAFASVRQAFSRPRREPLTTKAEAAAAERAQFLKNADEARARAAAAPAPAPEAAPPFDAEVEEWIGTAAADPAPYSPPEEEPQGERRAADDAGTWAPGTRQTGAYKCKLDDIGNAERFIMHEKGNVRYCATMTKWFIWDGKRMRLDDTEQVFYLASKTARALWQEIQYANGQEDRDARIAHAKKSGGCDRLNAMVTIARRLPGVAVRSKDIDNHPWLLNVSNGTVEIKKMGTGKELREHRRADFITKIINAPYVPGADCPAWMEFLNLIMGGNQNLIRYLQVCIGYCLSGDTSERALFVPWGSGANGKSTFLIAIHELFGEYAMKTPAATLVDRKANGIPNDIARLQGARFVYASETKEGCKLSEDTIKDLTGGEVLTARFMRGEFFEFSPNFKLWLATNHRPVINGTDKGIWDRIKLIPFIVRIPDVVTEPVSREEVLNRFRAEQSGILAWALEGARLYLQAGHIPEPPEVTTATSAYRDDMDTLAQFLDEYTTHTASPDFTVRAGVLYECFKVWAEANGEYVISQKVFSNRILERGYIRKKTPAGKVFLNLKLIKIPEGLQCTIMHGYDSFSDIDTSRSESKGEIAKKGTQPVMTLHSGDEEVEI